MYYFGAVVFIYTSVGLVIYLQELNVYRCWGHKQSLGIIN